MEVINQYKCEICETLYSNEEKAIACESGHKKIVKIDGVKYRPIKSSPCGYPSSVCIEFDDGRTVIYTHQ